MKVFIVHQVQEFDSDTGHDTRYRSVVYFVAKTREEAEKFIGSRSWWHSPMITEMEV